MRMNNAPMRTSGFGVGIDHGRWSAARSVAIMSRFRTGCALLLTLSGDKRHDPAGLLLPSGVVLDAALGHPTKGIAS